MNMVPLLFFRLLFRRLRNNCFGYRIYLLEFGNAVYAFATTERTDVLSVKGIRPMFPNPTSLLQASLQHLLVFGNADANFQNILNCMKYIKNIDN